MNDFTKDMANALFNQDKINDLFRRDDDKPYASIENKTIYVVKDQRKLKDRSIEKGVR